MVLGLRIPKLFYIFICMLFVFLFAQIGVDQFFVVIQDTANDILSREAAQFTNKSIYLSSSPILKPTEFSTTDLSLTAYKLVEDQVFIRSAFRVSDTEIRVTAIADYKNKKPIFYEYSNIAGQLSLKCNLPKCIETFSPQCKVVGYIGQILNVPEFENSSILRLRMHESQLIVEVPIIDVRPKVPGYAHQLGVCVQPIYMHAEYVVFMQFFEHWLSRGATKFYLYRHTYSKEVERILGFYIKTSNVNIELIDWSDLPSKDPNYDPNRYIYRLEVTISIFDCMHRASVKYLAQTDLDELVVINDGNKTLIEMMDGLSEENPLMVSASLVSRRAKLPPTFERISSPQHLNFTQLGEISAESYYFPRPIYTKLIHRPERTFFGHIHRQTGADKIGNDPKSTYKQVNVPNSKAYILHLRRVISKNFKLHRFTTTKMLQPLANEWQQNFQTRLKIYGNLSLDNWQNTGLDVLQKVETCRNKHENRRLKECHAVFDCDKGVNTTEWFKAANSWHLLY